MNRTKKISLIIVVLVLVTAAASSYFCYIQFSATSPPEETSAATEIAPDVLLGMDKMVVSTGVDALQRVKQSHTGNIVHVKDVAIVHYLKEDRMLTLWTTLYKNETVAKTENEKMVVGMRNWGGGWASNQKELTIAGKQVYQTAPDNVSHYFWADREWVFYIIPHNFTQQEISQIIGAIP